MVCRIHLLDVSNVKIGCHKNVRCRLSIYKNYNVKYLSGQSNKMFHYLITKSKRDNISTRGVANGNHAKVTE